MWRSSDAKTLNPFAVAPDGVAALTGVEKYLQNCGLDHKLIALREDAGVADQRLCVLPAHAHAGGSAARRNGHAPLPARCLARVQSLFGARAPDDVYTATRRQFSEKELADLSIVIAMINAWNRLAIGARAVHPAERAKAA